jgi:phosphatidylinositol-3-phosphatase
MRRPTLWVLGPLCALLLAACASGGPATHGPSTPGSTRVQRTTRTAPARQPDHIVVIVMENKEYDSVIGSSSAPYINRLATHNVLLTHEYAVSHPSLPNYLALTGGSTFGISSDCTTCYVHKTNLVDQLERKGFTWKAYMETMPSACYTGSFAGNAPNDYAKKHDPFIYFDDIRTDPQRCAKVVPFTVLKRTDLKQGLPDFAWITPNECHDMHDCSVQTGDDWLRQWVPKILADLGSNGILIITFDEGSSDASCCSLGSAGGHVATIIAGPGAGNGVKINANADHYSLLRLIEDAWNLPRMRHAADRSTPTIRGWRA